MKTARLITLDNPGTPDGVFRMYADLVDARKLAEGKRESVVTVTRTGEFADPRYPDGVSITREKLLAMIDKFKKRILGRDIFINKAHDPNQGAAATFRELFLDQGKLRARVEWTDFGVELVKKFGFRYLSAEFHENWVDNETGQSHGPMLLGAGLTIVPVVRHTEPVELSEQARFDCPTYLTDRLKTLLSEEYTQTMKKLLERLRKDLAAKKLPDAMVTQLSESFEKAAEHVGDDQERLEKLLAQFVETGESLAKQLAEATNPGEIKLQIEIPEASDNKTLSEKDIQRILDERQKTAEEATKKLQASLEANRQTFTDAIDNADGLKDLSEEHLTELKSASDLITAEMPTESVKKLAEHQIALGNRMAADAKLAQKGFDRGGPAGSVRVVRPEEDKNILALQEEFDKRVGYTDMSDSRRYARTGGSLPEENKKLADAVLATFDRERGAQLDREYRMLAGGDGIVSDVAVPSIYERTVAREQLYQLISLQFMDTGTYPFGESATIPYSYRDTTAAGKNDTEVYEGQGIPRAGVIQTTEIAYPIPQKLAFEVSDELRYLTRDSIYNWDAVAENTRNAVRIIGENTEQRNFNAKLAASHDYGAVEVTTEDLEPQADGTKNLFITEFFPIARPRNLYDLQGNQIGSTINPVTVSYDSSPVTPYDGTGTQSAGTYYVLDYDLGEIYLTDEAGDVQVPADGTAYTITYSRVTNCYAFDTDLGSDTRKEHWNEWLYRFALRKNVIEDDRFHMANFGIMSGNYQTQVEQAEGFKANFRVPGTDLSSDGNLGRIKDVPFFKTTAPGLHIGDRYAVIGERGVTRFRMMKSWMMNELENQKDGNGRFTGKKEAYGDQFIVVHTPTQLKRALTSVMTYSASARVAREI